MGSTLKVYERNRTTERCPSHPGALLDDIVPAAGKTKVEIANLLGISRPAALRYHP
jgi:antitoxin HigA-1